MRLLLAEDDAELGARLKRYLDRHGFAVDHLDNGVDAEFYGSETPYDVIVLDLGLPQRSGLEVLRRLAPGRSQDAGTDSHRPRYLAGESPGPAGRRRRLSDQTVS